MTAAIFGLIGVIVGGLIQSMGSWALDRRRDSWTVTKSARLLLPHITEVGGRVAQIRQDIFPLTWDQLQESVDNFHEAWEEHHAVFAGALDFMSYTKLSGADKAFAMLPMFAPDDTTSLVELSRMPQLNRIGKAQLEAFDECSILAMSGLGRQRVRRWIRRRQVRLLETRRQQASAMDRLAEETEVPPRPPHRF